MHHLVKAAELTDIAAVADLSLVSELITGGLEADLMAQSPTFTLRREGAWLAGLQAVAGWLLCGVCGFAGSVHPHEAPVRAARLTCLVAEQTAGLTRQGLSELVLSAETGLRQARELDAIRAGLAEETTPIGASEDSEALRVHLTAILRETLQAQAQPDNETDTIARGVHEWG
ncbi:hypothetical protein HTZ77_29935 [Nonomuraea sp. SMC257]|uniref:Uncharacterized protein n=1 Tax=Nonomuraea montanisoli TaxID=2741721 RepID=A0A7Y6IDQ1_9ACTN|nr:hypothetical protein [Nonomuraea montanisoli]NUW35620.1 hypothetical protein [Nonomuraea montanisoli]